LLSKYEKKMHLSKIKGNDSENSKPISTMI
jgi:hypothetical protein